MSPPPHRAALMPGLALLALVVGCRNDPPPPQPRTEQVLDAPAPTTTTAAPAPEAHLDCDTLLPAEEVKTLCGIEVEAPPDQPSDDLDLYSATCSRGWRSENFGRLRFWLTRNPSEARAREIFQRSKAEAAGIDDLQVLTGLGDSALRYVKRIHNVDIFNMYVMKGRFSLHLFSATALRGGRKVGPVCNLIQLEKVAAQLAARLP